MKFLINPVTQFEQNCSVICEQTNQSAFIDPGGDVDKLIEVLETLILIYQKYLSPMVILIIVELLRFHKNFLYL